MNASIVPGQAASTRGPATRRNGLPLRLRKRPSPPPHLRTSLVLQPRSARRPRIDDPRRHDMGMPRFGSQSFIRDFDDAKGSRELPPR